LPHEEKLDPQLTFKLLTATFCDTKQHGGFRALDNHGFFTMKQGKVYLLPSAVYYIHRNDLQSVIFGPLSCKKI